MADPKNFAEGNDKPEQNKGLTRTGIMLALLPVIQSTLAAIPGFDMAANVAHMRRTVRALATIAVRMMLDAGASPDFCAAQLIEALAHEVQERNEKAQAEGKAQADEAEALNAFPIFNGPSDEHKN